MSVAATSLPCVCITRQSPACTASPDQLKIISKGWTRPLTDVPPSQHRAECTVCTGCSQCCSSPSQTVLWWQLIRCWSFSSTSSPSFWMAGHVCSASLCLPSPSRCCATADSPIACCVTATSTIPSLTLVSQANEAWRLFCVVYTQHNTRTYYYQYWPNIIYDFLFLYPFYIHTHIMVNPQHVCIHIIILHCTSRYIYIQHNR